MKAMVLEKVGKPLVLRDVPLPKPQSHQVLIKVLACAICRTDLHILDGELKHPNLPLIMGHQIVGSTPSGDLVGAAWLGKSCGDCPYCLRGEENLCDTPTFTGYSINGGFAEYCVVDKNFLFSLPKGISPVQTAPLLCSGMIGYRSMKLAQRGKKIGFYGFGASAHLLVQLARYYKQEVYAFTRKGDLKTQEKAVSMGAVWAGDSETKAPELLDAAIIFASVGSLVPLALRAVRKGGVVVCAGIHMSDIPSFPYEILWGERVLRSVANLTRKDGEEFLALAAKIPIQTEVTRFPLEKTNEALEALRQGTLSGSAVITP